MMSLKPASLVFLCALFVLLVKLPAAPQSATLSAQRTQFLQARQLLRAGEIARFKALADKLQDYPLYPYLLHDYLRSRLWRLKDAEVDRFLQDYGDVPMAGSFRSAWLKLLAKRGRWQAFLRYYTPQTQIALQCHQLQARIKTGQASDLATKLLEDTRALWLVGESQPPECDPAFALLYQSRLMTDELIWQRIYLAMEKGNTSLASYLSRRLDAGGQKQFARWMAMHRQPARALKQATYKDTEPARRMLVHGIKRLARSDIDAAHAHWQRLQTAYAFSAQQASETRRELALRAARARHVRARRLLDAVPHREVDADIFHWRIIIALHTDDWGLLRKWTAQKPTDDKLRSRWLYWRARALAAGGEPVAANEQFKVLANERDYYGFMAADRLGQAYKMNHLALPQGAAARQEVSALPAIRRARELYHLGTGYPARREWHHALGSMSSYQMQIAAAIAADWGWHDRAIVSLGKAEAYDDLALRFPMPYASILGQYADKRALDLSWILALTRAESIFIEDARSPAGALGLMQVMPATGRETAQFIGFKRYKTAYLLDAKKNIALGSAYLRRMAERFGGSMILATAAYNAGPHNVTKWLPKSGCMDADIWIEKIPFAETRKYVQRILYFASIYDWRRAAAITRLAQRMEAVYPARQPQLAGGLNCAAPQLSLN